MGEQEKRIVVQPDIRGRFNVTTYYLTAETPPKTRDASEGKLKRLRRATGIMFGAVCKADLSSVSGYREYTVTQNNQGPQDSNR